MTNQKEYKMNEHTKEHKDNLMRLSTYLKTLPDDYDEFDMTIYLAIYDEAYGSEEAEIVMDKTSFSCKTAACAIGHAPAAGIGVPTPKQEDWEEYSQRVFGLSGCDTGWNYMFGMFWAGIDNTPKGAADRIDNYLAGEWQDEYSKAIKEANDW